MTAFVIVGGLFLAILLGALDQFVVLTALPHIVVDLGDATGAPFVISAYLVSATVGILVFGRLVELLPRRDVFLAGVATFVGGSVLAGLSQSLAELVAFRAVQGFSSGAFIILGFAIVAGVFPPESRARIAGLFTGTFVIATIAGPLLGSYIVDATSWRWVFYINVPIAAASVAAVMAKVARLPAARPGGFDTVGLVLLSGWVSALMFALIQNTESGWGLLTVPELALLGTAAALATVFLLWERRVPGPLLPLEYFRAPNFSASGIGALFRGVVIAALPAFLAIYVGILLLHGGADAADRVRDALYFFVVPVPIAAGIGSQLLHRVGYRPIAAVGYGLAAIGTGLLATVNGSTPLWTFSHGILPTGGLVLPLPLIGFGIGLTLPASILAAQFALPPERVGSATAVVQFLSVLGGAVGLSILAAFDTWRARALLPAVGQATLAQFQNAQATALQEVFLALLAMLVLGFGTALFLRGRLPEGVAHEARVGAPAAGARATPVPEVTP